MADDLYWGVLFDFYGALLTDTQRKYFDLRYNQDESLAEIAEKNGVSRQGVWASLRQTRKMLLEWEDKLGLVAQFDERQSALREIESALDDIMSHTRGQTRETAKEALQKVRALKDE